MKLTRKQKIFAVLSIAIVSVALLIMLLDWIIPLKLWVHPLLTFLLVCFAGFGLLSYFIAFIKRSPAFFFLGAFLLGLALVYVLICVGLKWYFSLIALAVLWITTIIIDYLIVGGFKTEFVENSSPDYKDYKTRISEKEEVNKNKETEELPKIKSFKD